MSFYTGYGSYFSLKGNLMRWYASLYSSAYSDYRALQLVLNTV